MNLLSDEQLNTIPQAEILDIQKHKQFVLSKQKRLCEKNLN